MDLTFFMKQDLASDLTSTLAKLTQNYRIAFGFYVDKLAMSFYSVTDRELTLVLSKMRIVNQITYSNRDSKLLTTQKNLLKKFSLTD
jgi:hypothetical protein